MTGNSATSTFCLRNVLAVVATVDCQVPAPVLLTPEFVVTQAGTFVTFHPHAVGLATAIPPSPPSDPKSATPGVAANVHPPCCTLKVTDSTT